MMMMMMMMISFTSQVYLVQDENEYGGLQFRVWIWK